MRKNNRKFDQARNLSIVPNFQKNAIGSVLIKFEDTQVICSTNISNNIPRWLLNKNQGWITAEYNMLPNSSSERVSRDRGGKLSGRTQEIQRLIGRTLRQAVDLSLIPGIVITVDCDVLNADGGTRTASITGSYISTYIALKNYYNSNPKKYFKNQVAAISLGKVDGEIYLDLDYSKQQYVPHHHYLNSADREVHFLADHQLSFEKENPNRLNLLNQKDQLIQSQQTTRQNQRISFSSFFILRI